MTDYIAALLAEQGEREDEENGTSPELETGALFLRRGSGGDETPAAAAAGAEIPAEGGDEPGAGGLTGRAVRGAAVLEGGAEALLSGLWGPAEAGGRSRGEAVDGSPAPDGRAELSAEGGGTRLPYGETGWTDRPGRGAAWLDGAVRRSLAAGSIPAGRGGQSVTVVRSAERNGGTMGAEGLDRLFRRDARRYDGGFQLL